MSTLEATIDQLPQPILDKLQSMIRRVRRLLFIRGFFATLAVGIVCLLAIMAIDATFTIFSSTARWALSLVGLGITLTACWWYLVRPLSRKFTLTHMARILEIRHPELQERISTAVELMGSDDPDSIKGSEELISAVVDSAVVDVEAVDPKAEFKPARSRKFLAVGVGALAIMLILLAIWPKQSWTLLTRAVAPFLDIGNAYANSLVVDPGDIRVATGSPVTIEVSVKHKRLKRAEIRRLLADGTETVERMTLIGEDEDGTKRFSMTFPSVVENFDYRVRAGSAVSEYYDVDAIDPPVIEELRISYDYPDYTKLEDTNEVTETGEIRAIAHTKVKVEATLNRPVWSSKMFINEEREVEITDSSENQISWEMELRSGTNGSWRIELADEEGFSNEPVSFPIEVLPDKAPTVQITEPLQKEFKLRPTETLPISAAITEDFGIANFTMLVTPDGAATPTPIALTAPAKVDGSGLHYGRASLNIAALNLEPNQKRIAVQLRAEDNRPADYDGPGVGLSETIYITLDQKAKSLADQAIEAQKKEVDEKIREAKRELERARDEMRRTEQELQRSDEVKPETRRRLDEFSEHTEKARDNLDEVAAELNQSIFQEQADQAAKISDENLAKAMEKADMIPVTDEKAERVSEARESREEIEKSIRELDSLAKAMREADDEYRAISELNQLANEQQELAQAAKKWAEEAQKRAEEMAANAQQAPQNQPKAQQQFDQAQQKELNQFQQKQNQVEKELGEMLKDNAAALAEVLEEQKEQADAMSAKADALAKQQEALKEANQEATQSREDQQEALKEQLIEQLQAMQEQLAEEASLAQAAAQKADDKASSDQESPDTGESPQKAESEESPAASESLAEAATKAAEAASELGERKLDEATESALSASMSLSDAADKSSESESTEAPTESAQNSEGEPPSEMAANDSASDEGAPSESESGKSEPADEGQPKENSTSAEAAALAGKGSETPASAELAQRQEAIAEQIAAVRDGNLQEALSLMEQALAAEADALQNEAEQFEQTMQNLSQNNAKSSADRAENALEQGTREAKEAAKQLDQAQAQQAQAEAKGQLEEGKLASNAQQSMQRSQSDQAQSASQLAQAAQHLANTSTNIGQTMEGLEPSDADEKITNSEDLAEGFEEVSEASDASSAQEAAEQSQEAANSLQKLAQQAMQNPGNGQQGNQPPQEGQNQQMPQDLAGDPQSHSLNETGKKTADANGSGVPPELLEMGINAEDWARFKGALTGGNATAIETDLPAEYRELVGRYFQVIAKEAGKK